MATFPQLRRWEPDCDFCRKTTPLVKRSLCAGKYFSFRLLQDHLGGTLSRFGLVACECNNHRGAPVMEHRRLLLAIGAAAGGLAAAAVVPIAFAHADDGVSDDGLTLVSGGP